MSAGLKKNLEHEPSSGTQHNHPDAATWNEHVDTFVGRDAEMAILRNRIDDAIQGKGSLVLISGEPGIGKTRLLTEAGRYAEKNGVRVLWGRCWEGDHAPAFWPWRQIARSLFNAPHDPPDERTSSTTDLFPTISQLFDVPNAQFVPDRTTTLSSSPAASFQLLDSIAHLLRSLTLTTPTLFIIDDIHDSDSDSLSLIEFVSSGIETFPLTLFCSYRSDVVSPDDHLNERLLPLLRHCAPARLVLSGLSEDDVRRLLVTLHYIDPCDTAFSREIFHRTAGNPFFIVETCRLENNPSTDSSLTHTDPPATVRILVRQRLCRVSADCRKLLEVASVLGSDIDLRLLILMQPGVSQMSAGAAVTEACSHGILVYNHSSSTLYSFSHALLRDCIYIDISQQRRTALHRRAVDAIRTLFADDLDSVLDSLAHHLVESGEHASTPEKADALVRAAARAYELLAYKHSARYYQRAFELLHPFEDLTRKCDLLLLLAESQLKAGYWTNARENFERALTTARRICSPARLAQAAIGIKGMTRGTLPPDWAAIRALREALAVVDESDSELKAKLLTALSTALYFESPRSERALLAQQAVEFSRFTADPGIIGDAIEAQVISSYCYDSTDLVLRFASEMEALGTKFGIDDIVYRARIFKYTAYIQCNSPNAFPELAQCTTLARSLRHPRYLWQVELAQASLALGKGDIGQAHSAIAEIRKRGLRFHDTTSEQHLLMLQFCLAKVVGDLSQLRTPLERLVALAPEYPLPRVGLAFVQAVSGQLDDARFTLAPIVCDGLQRIQPDGFALVTLCILAETLIYTPSVDWAEKLFERLAPFEDNLAVAGWGTAMEGAVAHFLAIVRLYQGDLVNARLFADKAIIINSGGNFQLWLARSKLLLASILHRSGDHLAEETVSEEAKRFCRTKGVPPPEVAPVCLPHSDEEADGVDAPGYDRGSRRRIEKERRNQIYREGEYWWIEYCGQGIRIRDCKGLRHISHLVLHAGKEISSVELTQLSTGRSVDQDFNNLSLKPICDLKADGLALSAYRARLAEIRQDLDDPSIQTDYGQIERLQSEKGLLEQQLMAAVGYAGAKFVTDPTLERARINVRNAISSTVRRVTALHPGLGRHLAYSIRTGRMCSYCPQDATNWTVVY